MKNYLRALKYLWPYKWLLLLNVLSGTIACVFDVSVIGAASTSPEVLFSEGAFSRIVGQVSEKAPFLSEPLARLGGIVGDDIALALAILICVAAGLTAVKALFDFVATFLIRYVCERGLLDLRAAVYEKLLCFPLGFFTKASLGDTISRFTNDLGGVALGFRTTFSRFVRQPTQLLAYSAVIVAIDWRLTRLRLTGMMLVALPLVAWAIRRLARRIHKSSTRALERRAEVVGLLKGTISGIKVVKVSQMESSESGRLRRIQMRLLREVAKVAAADSALGLTTEVIGMASVATLFFASAKFLDLQQVNAGTALVLLLAAYTMAYRAVKRITSSLGALSASDAAAARVFELMDHPPEAADVEHARQLPPLSDEICFDDVSFAYESNQSVIEHVSFRVRKGEVVAIVGGSGAGKTSLVNLIPRFYIPSRGRITIDGTDTSQAKLSSLRGQIGIVTQETILFDDTIFNNIAYGLSDVGEEEVIQAAKMANAHDFIVKLPDQYQTRLSGGLQTLSGGEQQRIALARAVVRDPAILILDEATSALDAESEALIQQALANIVRNRVTFIIAHRLSTIQLANKVVVLHKGRVESIGTHEELVRTSPVYRNLYALGFSDRESSAGNVDSRGETA